MTDIKWVGKHIEVAPPKRPKKITGTRLASIFGLNKWASPFKTWCEITKTYQEPFVDTKYTLAGKAIEPKQAEYMRTAYAMTNLVRPADIWGEDYFHKTYGDFFPQYKHFGGMWDYLVNNDKGEPEMVLEMKTTQRSEDWKNGVPEYYAIQAALYGWLLGVDDVVMVCTLLEPKDYDLPEDFVVSVDNTFVVPFKISEKYSNFEKIIKDAEQWWSDYIATGISPDFDEKTDAEILRELRTNSLNPDSDIKALIAEAEGIQAELDAVADSYEAKKKRLENLKKQIKQYMSASMEVGQKRAEIASGNYVWSISRSEVEKIDENRLKRDGLYGLYVYHEVVNRMTVSKKKEE